MRWVPHLLLLLIVVLQFSALIEDYQQLQSGYKDKFRERIHRQARIGKCVTYNSVLVAPPIIDNTLVSVASPDVTDAEVDTMIDQGEPQQMFADKILHDQRHNEAKNALIYIQEQHRDLMQVCYSCCGSCYACACFMLVLSRSDCNLGDFPVGTQYQRIASSVC